MVVVCRTTSKSCRYQAQSARQTIRMYKNDSQSQQLKQRQPLHNNASANPVVRLALSGCRTTRYIHRPRRRRRRPHQAQQPAPTYPSSQPRFWQTESSQRQLTYSSSSQTGTRTSPGNPPRRRTRVDAPRVPKRRQWTDSLDSTRWQASGPGTPRTPLTVFRGCYSPTARNWKRIRRGCKALWRQRRSPTPGFV